ncbi:hypothetical protein IQ07DRAFT_602561 [Pyrenochaeta sp. DS3sAY3a]|nr:hypothetical protein IQ07DRAFT_602561 [Pyrenochaeta sp. DS3sAY3a]
MHLPSLLSLPPALLALCATPARAEPQHQQLWPHNVPRHLKYFPEDEAHVKRSLDIAARLKSEAPIGIKKMGTDEGEMFMLENWIFAADAQPDMMKRATVERERHLNGSWEAQAPLRRLAGPEDLLARWRVRDVLLQRQFACPQGTTSCASIGAPDVCCGTSDTCINVNSNTDAGSVGCCPRGQTCAGSVSCDTANGYSSCPDSPNGGCCLPGFRCQGVGCVAEGTSTRFVIPSTSPTPSPPPSSTAIIVVPTTPSTSTSTYTCSTGWFSCAQSLGGGCCQNGRTCATGASCLGDSPQSTQAPSAPVRPTSASATPSPPSTTDDVCPTGFYVCSAYYPSGCCRVGRDCQTTGTCVLPTQTILDTNGVVIVAPTGAGVASTAAPQGGSCPSAWYSCAANRGGNCCPNGFECGEQCTATASGQTGVQGKVAPSTASFVSRGAVYVLVLASVVSGVAMVVL